MKVAILFDTFLDGSGDRLTVGGVQTYFVRLAEVCNEAGWKPVVFQCADRRFETDINNLHVMGVPVASVPYRRKPAAVYKAATQNIDPLKDILIFGADIFSVPTNSARRISIQHGVSWDLPVRFLTKKRLCMFGLGAKLKKRMRIRSAIKYFENCQNRVCVDYNFLNWYRTIRITEPSGRIWVIPNSAPTATPDEIALKTNSHDPVRVLFARRFTPIRGTRVMAEIADAILRSSQNVRFTFAGEGPDEKWLRDRFGSDPRVSFVKYLPNEALSIHLAHDIAVVPSVGCEGTSLSVAEAMGAGCAVVASAVGGITNMVLDGYNGLLAMPNAGSLLRCMERFIADESLRQRLGQNAYRTAIEAFNLVGWREKWRNVLEEISDLQG